MRNDFCVFILSHGRPDRVITFETLRKAGYTGRTYIVIDDEDPTGAEYRTRFGSAVLTFSKREAAEYTDAGDNLDSRKGVIYARNACFHLAERVRCRYFIQLDDDYSGFYVRHSRTGPVPSGIIRRSCDALFMAMVNMLDVTQAQTVCIAQGGDYFGGPSGNPPCMRRKAMNTFVCDAIRPFRFHGRINEDTTTYTLGGRRGELFCTMIHATVNQIQTQAQPGGMTGLYLESGTYVKTFYSVMYTPSAVRVGVLSDPQRPENARMHHQINWDRCAAKILRETWRRPRAATTGAHT